MVYLIRYDLRRILSARTLLSCLLFVIFPLFSVWNDVIDRANAMDSLSMFVYMRSVSPLYFLCPALCTIPYAASYCNESINNNLILLLSRTSRKRYFASRVIMCAMSGGGILGIGTILQALMCILIFPIQGSSQSVLDGMFAWSLINPILLSHANIAPYIYMGYEAMLCFIFGAIWSLVGLSLSVLKSDRYLALCGPFILVYSLHYLTRISGIYGLSPLDLIRPLKTAGLMLTVVYSGVVSVLAIFAFYKKIVRGAQHES